MINHEEINVALAAADQPIMVETAAQLDRATESWLECPVIGIDTEFVRERTWRADIGLVQISDGKHVWLVDPLKTGSLHSLSTLLEDQSVIKVLHAPSEDLSVLLYTTGAGPEPLFDTQIACAMLGQPLQLGYHTTVEWLLNLTIDKGETRSNWCKRPLRPAQLHYAALDVCLLPTMHRQLSTRLEALGRDSWLEEDSARLVRKAREPDEPEQSWKRINGHGRLNGSSLAILQSLATWRDNEAERRNLARGFVIKDAALLTIAKQQPTNVNALSELDIWHPNAVRRFGETLTSLIDKILQEGLVATHLETLTSAHKSLMADMRKLVLQSATELSVDPALLASRRELEHLILLPENELLSERFLGWRKEIITEDLLALKEKFYG